MYTRLIKCPVCSDHYGTIAVNGKRHNVNCKCDKVWKATGYLLCVIVGISFVCLVAVQTEKNLQIVKKVVDGFKLFW